MSFNRLHNRVDDGSAQVEEPGCISMQKVQGYQESFDEMRKDFCSLFQDSSLGLRVWLQFSTYYNALAHALLPTSGRSGLEDVLRYMHLQYEGLLRITENFQKYVSASDFDAKMESYVQLHVKNGPIVGAMKQCMSDRFKACMFVQDEIHDGMEGYHPPSLN